MITVDHPSPSMIYFGSVVTVFSLVTLCVMINCWSCRSVYRRQDVCVAKVILWILSSCTYWWENRYPYPPLLHDGTTPHNWLMTPYPIWLMTPLPILGWWPPYPYLADYPPPPLLVDDPPHPYLADDPPTHTCLMTPPPNGWMMCWVKLVLVLYVWRQDRMRPAQQGLPFIVICCSDILWQF